MLWLCDDQRGVDAILALGPPKIAPRRVANLDPRADGVAVVELRGVLTKDGTDYGMSTADVAAKVRAAANDPTCAALVLLIDSPGGEVSGTTALADAVAQCTSRKPTFAVVEDLCTSGAYLVASQCSRIFSTNRLARFGSIGVYGVLIDSAGAFEKLGLKTVRIRSGELKGIGAPGIEISDDEQAHMRDLVMFASREFITRVANGRHLPPDQVRTLATGAAWPAPEAQRLGLVDGILSLENVIASIDRPLIRLAIDARQFAQQLERLEEAGQSAWQAEQQMFERHQKLAASADKFRSLPPWQQSQLTNLAQGNLQ